MRYSENTIKYYNNMENIGSLDDLSENVGTGIVGSPLCGDVMKLQLLFDENDNILDAKYKVFGCISAIASMEFVTTLLKGKTMDEALKVTNDGVADSLELTQIKRHCSVLAQEAIEAAVKNYMNKKLKVNDPMITISKEAISSIKKLINNHGEKCKGIYITIATGGCSGIDYSLSYELETNEASQSKKSLEIEGIKFFFEEKDDLFIDGLEIDVVTNSFGDGFIINNKKHKPCEGCTCQCSGH
jgi:nitrogen fixation NifU-like protein